MENIWENENLIKVLNGNGVVVMPTDTIYGVVGKAFEKETVERIYSIKKRDKNKPMIVLIGDIKELEKFSINLSDEQRKIVKKYWLALSEAEGPGPVSVVFKCSTDLSFLHRGTGTLALRLPSPNSFRDFLMKTGPLIATSANPEGFLPAETIDEAKNYFGDSVDLYIDGGELKNRASKLLKLNEDNSITVLRE